MVMNILQCELANYYSMKENAKMPKCLKTTDSYCSNVCIYVCNNN